MGQNMIESDEGSNVRQIVAARVIIGLDGLSSKCQVLISSVLIRDRAGLVGFINGVEALARMDVRA